MFDIITNLCVLLLIFSPLKDSAMVFNQNCRCYFRGTIEDTELIDGLVFNQKSSGVGGPNKVEKAKIGLIQFCISPPKTDVNIYVHRMPYQSKTKNKCYCKLGDFHIKLKVLFRFLCLGASSNQIVCPSICLFVCNSDPLT